MVLVLKTVIAVSLAAALTVGACSDSLDSLAPGRRVDPALPDAVVDLLGDDAFELTGVVLEIDDPDFQVFTANQRGIGFCLLTVATVDDTDGGQALVGGSSCGPLQLDPDPNFGETSGLGQTVRTIVVPDGMVGEVLMVTPDGSDPESADLVRSDRVLAFSSRTGRLPKTVTITCECDHAPVSVTFG